MKAQQTKRHSFRPLLFAPPQGSDAMRATIPAPPPLPRGRQESHVRLRSAAPAVPAALAAPPAADVHYLDAQELLDELCEDHLNLAMSLACLERAAEDGPRDPSARAALRALESKVGDLFAVRDALGAIQQIAVDRRLHRLFVPDAALAEYLRGIYAWLHAVVRALDDVATTLHSLSTDWALFRWRIEEAKNFHFDELHDAVRADLAALAVVARVFRGPPARVDDLAAAVGRLFSVAETLEASLDQRFG